MNAHIEKYQIWIECEEKEEKKMKEEFRSLNNTSFIE